MKQRTNTVTFCDLETVWAGLRTPEVGTGITGLQGKKMNSRVGLIAEGALGLPSSRDHSR